MNPAKHTPGPWRTEPAPHRSHWILGSVPVALTVEPSEANARLIAAAPDLLAALRDMIDRYARAMKDSGVSHYPEAMVEIRSARAAIAKATGGAA